jgi:hypothetical protein
MALAIAYRVFLSNWRVAATYVAELDEIGVNVSMRWVGVAS